MTRNGKTIPLPKKFRKPPSCRSQTVPGRCVLLTSSVAVAVLRSLAAELLLVGREEVMHEALDAPRPPREAARRACLRRGLRVGAARQPRSHVTPANRDPAHLGDPVCHLSDAEAL